ncbi:MAG: amidohydrolase family protein, partial [Clostridiales bacterium]|nr:amidohydrolase family protein [Clostridiales bacterium]
MKTLIKHGLLVLTEGCTHADLLIDGDKIAAIGQDLKEPQAEIYDAEGCMVFPGFIDAHTHLDMPADTGHTADNFMSGSRAALMGGVTTILDFATQKKRGALQAAFNKWQALAARKAFCDYGFHMAITSWNEAVAAEMPGLTARGVTSYKVYMAYNKLRLDDAAIYDICRHLRLLGGLLMLHCENGDLIDRLSHDLAAEGRLGVDAHALSRPPLVEEEAVVRALAIAEAADAVPYIVHLSSLRALEAARAARRRGQKLWLETCPQYLFLDDTRYLTDFEEAAKYVCAPPLRSSR